MKKPLLYVKNPAPKFHRDGGIHIERASTLVYTQSTLGLLAETSVTQQLTKMQSR